MKDRAKFLVSLAVASLMLLSSCITAKYIQDEDSLLRQQQIHRHRIGNVVGSSFLTAGSAFLAAFTGIYLEYLPATNLKKIALSNTSPDTLQVNMLTDKFWKDSVFCDFRDIRIPPGETCRLLVPVGSVYNLYFSNTPQSGEDDELIQFDTFINRKVSLYPGLTSEKDSLTINKTIYP
jgi:hypothetical protein